MSVHTVSSESPLVLPSPLPVLTDCGRMLERPQLAFLWDEQEMGEMVSYGINVCRLCRKVCDKKHVRYVYGVNQGEEAESA